MGDWWDDLTGTTGSSSGSSDPGGSICPAGQVEFGTPSRCGSQADYNAYVQAQVAGAYGGDTKKADQYLQTTQYGAGQNMGCSYPNQYVVNAKGAAECMSPARAVDTIVARGGGDKGVVKFAKPGGGTECYNTAGAVVKCPDNYQGAGGSSGIKTTPVNPITPTPIGEDSTDWLPLAAVGALLAGGAFLVWRKKQKARGLT
jgi:LPXTG-motif cell wall-anchored protein